MRTIPTICPPPAPAPGIRAIVGGCEPCPTPPKFEPKVYKKVQKQFNCHAGMLNSMTFDKFCETPPRCS